MTGEDVEDIIEQSKEQDRATSEPTTPPTEQKPDLDEAAAEAYAALDEGTLAPNITVRDDRLAGLFEALDETGRIAAIEADANDAIGRNVETEGNKASLARALLRVGFNEVAPGAFDDAIAGYKAHDQKQKSELESNF